MTSRIKSQTKRSCSLLVGNSLPHLGGY